MARPSWGPRASRSRRRGRCGELSVGDDPVVEPHRVRLGGADEIAGHEQPAARPAPTTRGKRYASPCRRRRARRGEEERDLARSAAIRMSAASASMAPAPATVPFSAATMGRRQARMAATTSQVIRVKSRSPCVFLEQLADDRLDVAPGAETTPGAGEDDGAHVGLAVEGAEDAAQLVVDLEGQGVQPIRAIRVSVATRSSGRGRRETHRTDHAITAVPSISTMASSGDQRGDRDQRHRRYQRPITRGRPRRGGTRSEILPREVT